MTTESRTINPLLRHILAGCGNDAMLGELLSVSDAGFLKKPCYICGPLTEVPEEMKPVVKAFYVDLADACKRALGIRAFVPHEHYDPVLHAGFSPAQVDISERRQVCENASFLVVAASFGPTWGGGIEVEMAYQSGVPIILLCDRAKLEARKISRLLRGNPGIVRTIVYQTEEEAIGLLFAMLSGLRGAIAIRT